MLYITSLQNSRIKALKLLKKKSGREESGTYLIEGKRAVLDALTNGVHFECILIQDNFLAKLEDMLENADCDEFIQVSPEIIDTLSETSSPEGIIAQAKIAYSEKPDYSKLKGLVVLIDHLQDPGNLGTIIRTADAAGASAIILSNDCVDLYNSKTIRSTMGSIFNIPIFQEQELSNVIIALKNEGYLVYATSLNGEDFFQRKIAFFDKTAIIIGNEGNGITENLIPLSSGVLTLPINGKAESINAAVAAGILIYNITFNK